VAGAAQPKGFDRYIDAALGNITRDSGDVAGRFK
jgi:hypothetical protein